MMAATVYMQQANYTAIVSGPDGVRFIATAQCPEQLAARIVGYITERCDEVLWPEAASQVRAFIEDGKPYAAIAAYFANVGERWDEEHLDLGGLSFGEPRSPKALPKALPQALPKALAGAR